jgi:hypothetical protein
VIRSDKLVMSDGHHQDGRDLEADLAREIGGEVRFDAGSRAIYAHDASNHRQPPIGVAIPRSAEDVEHALRICHRHGAPVVSRGGGTSLEPAIARGIPIVGLEPSCVAAFRDELPSLPPGDDRARRLSGLTHTLAGFLRARDHEPPPLRARAAARPLPPQGGARLRPRPAETLGAAPT